MNIGGVEIGAGQPCRVIAELSCNHGGDFDRATRMMDAAKAAGADLAKVQCYSADELVALRGDGPAPAQWGEQGWTMRALYEKAQTPRHWFEALFAYSEAIELPLFSSVFGLESLALLESLGCPAYKIARLDNAHAWLIEAALATGKPVLLSDDRDPNCAAIRHPNLVSLRCPRGYPADMTGAIPRFTGPPSGYLGFSYHGTSIEPCVVAAVLGAKVLEVHVHLHDEPSELEANISLTMGQLATLVERVRAVEAMLA
jgi:pseudaminic acid synthase